MSGRRGFLRPCTRLLAVIVLLTAFFVGLPQTALADPIVTFNISTPSSNGMYPYDITEADFNGDGNPDLAIADQVSASIAIFLGKGDGTFTVGTSVPFPLVGFFYTADVNGDGKPDLIDVRSQLTGGVYVTNLYVRFGNGDGTFGTTIFTTTVPFFTTNGVFGDINGDGNVDAILTDPFNNQVRILKGNGGGTFAPSTIIPSGGANPFAIVVGDWFADGKTDIGVVNSVGGNVGIFRNTGNDASGSALFAAITGSPFPVGPGLTPVALDFWYLAGRTLPDIAVVAEPTTNPTTTPGILLPFINNGAGGFTKGASQNVGILPGGVKLAPMTGSGNTDAVVFNYPATSGGLGSASVYAGNGNGTFASVAAATIALGHGVQKIALGDFNRDGKTDAVATNADDNTITVATNTTTPYLHPTPHIDLLPIEPVADSTVTITGSGFVAGLRVSLDYFSDRGGVNQVATVVYISADGTQIRCILPEGKTGKALVIVNNPDGQEATYDILPIIHVNTPPASLPPRPPAGNQLPTNPKPLPGRDLEVACNVSPCSPHPLPTSLRK